MKKTTSTVEGAPIFHTELREITFIENKSNVVKVTGGVYAIFKFAESIHIKK